MFKRRVETFGNDLGLMHQFILALRSVTDSSDIARDFVKLLAEDRRMLKRVLTSLTSRYGLLKGGIEEAREIMGENLYTTSDVSRLLGVTYTVSQLVALEEIPFTADLLNRVKHSHLLIAGSAVTIQELATKFVPEAFFYPEQHFENDRPSLEPKDITRLPTGWYLINNQLVPGSKGKTRDKQLELLDEYEQQPTSIELTVALILYWKRHGTFFLNASEQARCDEGCIRIVPDNGHGGKGITYSGFAGKWRSDGSGGEPGHDRGILGLRYM
ncbi:MAG: hypothetical protein Q7R48_04025 [bacterium]|nr:hypothetical protein [bacterium]